MSYGPDLFPIITTKRVHISNEKKKIKVDFCINVPDSPASRDSLRSISEILYFYFMILDDSTARLLPTLRNPETRARLLMSIYRNQIRQRGHKRISLQHIFDNHTTIQHSITDLSGDQVNEMRYSVDIPLNYPGYEYENLPTEKLHLVCFVHSLVHLAPAPFDIGGETISYDLLLNRSQNSGILEVPEFVDSFYIRDSIANSADASSPYYGPAHYHGEENPGPDGYIGWMVGHAEGEMGPRLEVRKTRNYKVTSDLALSVTQQAANDTSTPRHSSMNLLPSSDLRQQISHNNLLKTAEDFNKDMQIYAKEKCLMKPNIVDYGQSQDAYINLIVNRNGEEDRQLEESHYGCTAGINFLDLVRHRSRLGYIIDFHHNHSNHDIIEECLYKSNIKNMTISRYRVVNRPNEINERQTKKYTKYNKNEQEQVIVSSSDFETTEDTTSYHKKLKHRLYYGKTKKGTIEEVELMTLPTNQPIGQNVTPVPGPKYSRQFIIRDKDMFHNIKSGKYTYAVDISLNDGVFQVFKELYRSSKKAIEEYDRLLFRAQIPKKVDPINPELPHVGNYDYASHTFDETFKNSAENQKIVDTLVNFYHKIRYYLTGDSSDSSGSETYKLKNALYLKVARLEDLIEFYFIMREMISTVKSLTFSGISQSQDRAKNTESLFIRNGAISRNNLIHAKSNLGVFATAFSDESVIADYAPRSDSDSPQMSFAAWSGLVSDRIARVTVSSGLAFQLSPNRFLTVETSTEEEEPNSSVTVNSDKREAERQYDKSNKGKKSKTFGKSAIRILSTRNSFRNQNLIQKSNTNLQIEYVINSQNSGEVGQADRPPSYYPLATQRYNGGISLGLSKGGFTIFNGDLGSVLNMLDFIPSDLSEGVKKSICESVYVAKNKDHFLEEVLRRYKDLVESREILGSFYETVHRTLLSADVVYSKNTYNTNYLDRYENATPEVYDAATVPSDVYENQTRQVEILLPGLEKVMLNTLSVNTPPIRPMGPGSGPRLLCVSYARATDSEPAVAVNNVVFLEV